MLLAAACVAIAFASAIIAASSIRAALMAGSIAALMGLMQFLDEERYGIYSSIDLSDLPVALFPPLVAAAAMAFIAAKLKQRSG